MASIYAVSIQVLVLDAELLKTYTTSAPTGVLACVLASTWMCRRWTLQEGLLAQECVFQLVDASIDPLDGNGWSKLPPDRSFLENSIFRAFRSKLHEEFLYHWKYVTHFEEWIYGNFEKLSAEMAESYSRSEKLMKTWNALSGRSTTTTMTTDLFVIFAKCLNFSAAALMDLDNSEDKMRQIVFSFRILPFPFYNTGPRYAQKR